MAEVQQQVVLLRTGVSGADETTQDETTQKDETGLSIASSCKKKKPQLVWIIH